MDDWKPLMPEVVGTLPGGGVLRRTDPCGPTPAPVAILGVYPALTAKRTFSVNGTRMTLPTAVEARSFDAGSASGAEIDDNYLAPIGLDRARVFITDMMPYYLANTSTSSSGRSMADNIRHFEQASGRTTGVQPRPPSGELVRLASTLPGNLDRLSSYFAACRPRVVLTLGTEPAAFLRGMTFAAASKQTDALLYAAPIRLSVFGFEADVVHLVHPHLFIKKNAKWMTRHGAWCRSAGRALVAAALQAKEQ